MRGNDNIKNKKTIIRCCTRWALLRLRLETNIRHTLPCGITFPYVSGTSDSEIKKMGGTRRTPRARPTFQSNCCEEYAVYSFKFHNKHLVVEGLRISDELFSRKMRVQKNTPHRLRLDFDSPRCRLLHGCCLLGCCLGCRLGTPRDVGVAPTTRPDMSRVGRVME